MKDPISVTILTKNSQKYLKEVLDALKSFDEVLIYDTGSTDDTFKIAQEYPKVTIVKREFIGFGPSHNMATSIARNDWILSIDSDEIVTPELSKEINSLSLRPQHVYSFPRHNEYKGKWIKWCGWHPDRQIRLYNRKDTSFTDAQVHEAIQTQGMKEIQLQSPLRHYSYTEVSDFLSKMQSYSDLFAKQNQGRKKSSLGKALTHGFFAFFKSYIIKKGLLGGQEGFEISYYNANTAFYKYLKLAEVNRKAEKGPVDDPKKKVSL
jgi:glycosyltransferase involved in cell wall biosynthesis